MSEILNFVGFIKGVSYKAYLTEELETYNFDEFDINSASSCGLINMESNQVSFSKWVSPKRTRTYPFERIYNTYNSPKILTVIPIIKDEGLEGDLDKIQYSTFSRMNLLNIYIVLGYYESADKKLYSKERPYKYKLTNQKFNNDFIKEQIYNIIKYKQSALHWNKNLFEDRFTEIFDKALKSYQNISKKKKVKIHSQKDITKYLSKIQQDFQNFKEISLKNSKGASLREVQTSHKLEFLESNTKAQFLITNYLGGIYYLTADEVIFEKGKYIIQESKNSKNSPLPSNSDIKDGLFKLILYSNLDSMELNGYQVSFSTRLKLTGKGIVSSIKFPVAGEQLNQFITKNSQIFSKSQIETIKKLYLESTNNKNLEIEIKGNN